MNNQNPQGHNSPAVTFVTSLLAALWVFTAVEGVTLILLVAFARGVWR